MPRRILALVAVAVAAFAVLAIVLTRGGGDKERNAPTRLGDPRAEALAYAPSAAPALVGVDTGSPGASLVLGALVPRVSGGALSTNDISPLLGNEAVVALLDPRTGRSQMSLVAKDPDALRALTRRLRSAGSYRGAQLFAGPRGSAAAVKGQTLVAASDEPTVRRALDTGADRSRHLTPAQFDRRLAGLSPTAEVRAVFDPKRAVVITRLPGLLRTRWGRSLTNGAAELTTTADGGLRVPFKLQTDASRLTDQDLPFATGRQIPQIRGRAPLLIGVRDLSRMIAFLRRVDPDRLGGLDTLQTSLPGFLRVNVNGLLGGLTNDGTLSSADLLAHFVARTEPQDPGAWRRPLDRLSTLSDVLKSVGVGNMQLDERGGEYRLTIDGDLAARVALFGRTLVISDDPGASLRAAARAPAVPAPAGAAGGLTVRLRAADARGVLSDAFGLPPEASLVLDRLGDLTGWARAERDAVGGELRVGIR